jgi:peptidoglycan-N-acetylglucosamine deacetylase
VVSLFERLWPGIRWRQPGGRPLVSLTIDDGPDPLFTTQLLRILRQRNIRATFFLVGERVRRYPELVNEICRDGHEIGNHGDTWRRTIGLDVAAFEQDVTQAEEALASYPCFRKLFRPAGIMFRRAHLDLLMQRGYECVLGSAYAFDPYRPPSRFIAWAISRAMRPGAVIVVHDSGGDRTTTIDAIPAIIDAAERKGLTFVPASELLAEN